MERVSKDEYLKAIEKIKNKIKRGDIYELNYCIEFFAKDVLMDMESTYLALNKISEAPFSSISKFDGIYIACSSPERFLKKENDKLITQPIKGTAKRSLNTNEDEILAGNLKSSLKERTENVMIVDVSRNDLSRIAERGSVKVSNLFEVQHFLQVHQLVSTIEAKINTEKSFKEIIHATFPMASMTGAPKISAMEIIEEQEKSARGIYSGTLGYIHPTGDFDFNVVIRSLLYNTEKKHLSFSVGSAITHLCNAEEEYEECMLKAKAMMSVLMK
jgi:para-aminobenzoate synthetase component 1